MRKSAVATAGLGVMLALVFAVVSVAEVRYIYDDAGRLSQASDDQGNVATASWPAPSRVFSCHYRRPGWRDADVLRP